VDGTALHFVHACDSHVRSGLEHFRADLASLTAFVERVKALRESGVAIDFVVHTGDLVDEVDDPDAASDATRAALSILDGLPVRWFLLNGNHDRRAILVGDGREGGDVCPSGPGDASPSGPADVRPSGLGDVPAMSRAGVAVREVGGVQLIFVDANPESGGRADLYGELSPEAVATLAWHMDDHPGQSVVFLHYPPLAQEASWPGACVGGGALHALLVPRAESLYGVFVGHNHRAVHHLRDGVLYTTAPALTRQFLLWPGQETFAADDEPVSGLHYVTLETNGATRVQHHAFVDLGKLAGRGSAS